MSRTMGMTRDIVTFDLSIADGTATSGTINFSGFAGGLIIVPSVWTTANIGFYVSDAHDGTYVIFRDDTGVPVQISGVKTNGSRAYKLPDDIFPCTHIKLWSKDTTAATESDVNQAGKRSLVVICKG